MTIVLLDILFNKSIGKTLIFFQTLAKNRVPLGITAKKRVSQIFLELIQNRVPSRPAQLEAAYLEVLLYKVM